jgi:hypothetical protein
MDDVPDEFHDRFIFREKIFSRDRAYSIRIYYFHLYALPSFGSEAIRETTEDMKGGNGGKLNFIRF